jgi:universal stress protein E
LRTADQFRSALHGTLHVVHAFVPTPADAKASELLDPDATHILEARARTHARARLEPLLKNLQIARSSKHLVGEHPVNAIPRLARRIGCDILVMGALSRSGLKRIFIGNTAERILDEIECDVLVVKPPGFVGSKTRVKASRSPASRRSRSSSVW